MERLDHFDEEENAWQEAVIVDTKAAPVSGDRRLPLRFQRLAEAVAEAQPPHRRVPGPRESHERHRPEVPRFGRASFAVEARTGRFLAAIPERGNRCAGCRRGVGRLWPPNVPVQDRHWFRPSRPRWPGTARCLGGRTPPTGGETADRVDARPGD